MSPTFSATRESIAVISGSGSDYAATPEGGNTAGSPSPERERELWAQGGELKETDGSLHTVEKPSCPSGRSTDCGVLEG